MGLFFVPLSLGNYCRIFVQERLDKESTLVMMWTILIIGTRLLLGRPPNLNLIQSAWFSANVQTLRNQSDARNRWKSSEMNERAN